MLGERRRDAQAADRDALALVDLDDVAELAAPQQLADAPRADDRQLAPEPLERRQVEMVPVPVRDECGVQPAERRGRGRARSPEVQDAVAQHGIREQSNAVHVDEHRRVPDVRDAKGHG